MNLKQYFGTDDRGVSPVIGVILMVAITVILAAVIATFVMNMGPNESTPANANWDFSNETDYFTLEHTGGGAAPVSEYEIQANNDNFPLSDMSGDSLEEMTAGDTLYINGSAISGSPYLDIGDHPNATDEVQLVWQDPEGDQSQVINTWDN